MKNWFANLSYKLQGFMQGRYGNDALSRFLSIAGLALLVLSFIRPLRFLYVLALAALIWSWFRFLSRNFDGRRKELDAYLRISTKLKTKLRVLKNRWQRRKTHKYLKCPQCKAVIYITKPAKGRTLSITCPRCSTSFTKKT